MNNKVKEFFNNLSQEKRKINNPHLNKRSYRTAGIMPEYNFSVPNIKEFSHFIECETSPLICPMIWEDLEIDFKDNNRRHCEYCDKFVYKADNEFMIKSLKEDKKCMAISNVLLEKINGKIDEEKHNNLQYRIAISKLFLVYKKYKQKNFEELYELNLSQEEQLKEVILNILNGDEWSVKSDIELLNEKGVDVELIFTLVLNNIRDEDFKKMVLDRINDYNFGGKNVK